MRNKLKKLGFNKRYTFTAEYGGVGYKRTYGANHSVYYNPTIVLKNVEYNGNVVTDHVWFNYTLGFAKLQKLQDGDIIQFDGRVGAYTKGTIWQGYQRDYDITRPTKIKLINRDVCPDTLPMPNNDKNALVGYIMTVNKDFYLANNRPYEPWYVQQYQSWKDRRIKKETPSRQRTDVVPQVQAFLTQTDTKLFAKSRYNKDLKTLQKMTDENTDNYSALYRQLKVCQLQSQKFARNVRNTRALNQAACLNSSKIKYLVQMGTFRDDLLRYQKLSADLYKFDQQDCIDIKQVMIESVEFRHLVKKLNKSIYITVSARGTAKNILAKYAPEKMAFMHGTKSQYPKIRQHYLMLYDQLLQLYQRNDFSFEKAKQMTDIASRLKMLCIEFNGNHPVFVRKMQHKVNVLNRYDKLCKVLIKLIRF